MNPFVKKIAESAVRNALQFIAGMMVAKGVWSQDEASVIIGGLASAIVAVAWSFYEKYKSQQKLVTALASPIVMTEAHVENLVRNSEVLTPSVTTPKDEIPKAEPPKA